MSYLPKPKKANGARGEDAFKSHFIEGVAKLASVIGEIENTGDESTMMALAEYKDGVPVELVAQMLENIRTDLLKAKRELEKAAETI